MQDQTHAIEAQRQLLAALFENPEIHFQLRGLTEEDFTDGGKPYRSVWAAIKQDIAAGKRPTIASVAEKSGWSLETIAQIESVPYDLNHIDYYIEVIVSAAKARMLQNIRQADSLETAEKYLDLAKEYSLRIPTLDKCAVAAHIDQYIAEAEVEKEIPLEKRVVSTPLTDLNHLVGGMFNGDFICVAARPGLGKCLGIGTKVVMYDGTLKAVETVEVGDLLLGPDSAPRKVLSLGRGREMMYWIHQNSGISYRVNAGHILSLKRSKSEGKWSNGDTINVPVYEIKDKGPGFFSRWKGYKVAVEFNEKPLSIDPYFLGLWLGDGKSSAAHIYTIDPEVVSFLEEYALRRGEKVIVKDANRPCPAYLISGGRSHDARKNSLQAELNHLGVLRNKYIPQQYLCNTTENRLSLLAGLIDSDGWYHDSLVGYEIVQKNKELATQIKFLCDSLGFKTRLSTKKAKNQYGYVSEVYRLSFSGDVERIPVKIRRKKARSRQAKVNWQVSGISIVQDKIDDYYGFTLDGDGLFLLEDMTVTHNTAFTGCVIEHVLKQGFPVATFILEMTPRRIIERFAARNLGIEVKDIIMLTLDDQEQARLYQYLAKLRDYPWTIYSLKDGIGSFSRFREVFLGTYRERPFRLATVDYIQLMNYDGIQNRVQEVGAIANGIARMATEVKVPIIGVSQLSRAVETRQDKRPILSDLRESGDIEQAAAGVWFLYREGYYERDTPIPNVAEIGVPKSRYGDTGVVEVFWNGKRMMFADLQRDSLY